jgi:hypothetical protein
MGNIVMFLMTSISISTTALFTFGSDNLCFTVFNSVPMGGTCSRILSQSASAGSFGARLLHTLEIVGLPTTFRVQLIPHSYILLSHLLSLPGFCIPVLSLQAKMGQGGGKTKNSLWARVHSKTACKRSWVPGLFYFSIIGFLLMHSQRRRCENECI